MAVPSGKGLIPMEKCEASRETLFLVPFNSKIHHYSGEVLGLRLLRLPLLQALG
jgi:hypothetical protein